MPTDDTAPQSAPTGDALPITPNSPHIRVQGARVHNLQNVDLVLPKRKLVVFTGPSGSGKSSLAFDTLYAEGRRRYVESLSTFARQFLGQVEKPDVDQITGLSPTISIDQKTVGSNPRSTVGTITEIHDHLRVLYAQLGRQHCHQCGDPVAATTPEAMVHDILALPEGTRLMLLAPLVRNRKGEYRDLFEKLRKSGFARARIDGEFVELGTVEKVALNKRHDIDVVVDRLIVRLDAAQRIHDSVELAMRTGEGRCLVLIPAQGDVPEEERLLSRDRSCARCNLAFPELTHQSFSFNSPLGMCPVCDGLGSRMKASAEAVVVEPHKTILDGALEPLGPAPESAQGAKFKFARDVAAIWAKLEDFAKTHSIKLGRPWAELAEVERELILHGAQEPTGESVAGPAVKKRPGRAKAAEEAFPGVLSFVESAQGQARTQAASEFFGEFLEPGICPACEGRRLRPESRAVHFRGRSVDDIGQAGIQEARQMMEAVELNAREQIIAGELMHEIVRRLRFLENVGLDYLNLTRSAATLSGGESQRIRLASQLGSSLSGVLYVLDEPSIGLHQRDHDRLLDTLQGLRDAGNTVIVVEHDRETMERADFLVDFGPGAGRMGGTIVACGTPAEVAACPQSITGDYLAGRKRIEHPGTRRTPAEGVRIFGARENNLKNIDVHIPARSFVCVTGVSGAGKSTLVNDILLPALARKVYFKHRTVGAHDRIEGLERYDKVIEIDQSPIGRTPRSNPATYTKLFDLIRQLFAQLPESRMYGFEAGRFSFNVAGGRCEECLGAGVSKVEMSFLADVYVPCNACLGRRFNPTTLRVTYRGRSIADVLDMTVAEAAELFEAYPKIRRILETLMDVGLDYMKIGQPSPTLSGGEAQRIKLSRELAKIATGDTLYILDEPSTGLHFDDIRKLLEVVDKLVDAGNTVVMIEHNLDIIAYADYVIDIGPEGGTHGGHVVACGTPEDVAACPESHTGRFLRAALG